MGKRRCLLVVGDANCGKTCLIIRFVKNEFPEKTSATILDYYTRNIAIHEKETVVTIFDSTGLLEQEKLRSHSYAAAHAIVLCFSLTEITSLNNVSTIWRLELSKYCPKVPVVLVGLKKDLFTTGGLERIPRRRCETIAEEIKAVCYVECSAKLDDGVKETFTEAVLAASRYKRSQRCTVQ